jgi:hypothetical protein
MMMHNNMALLASKGINDEIRRNECLFYVWYIDRIIIVTNRTTQRFLIVGTLIDMQRIYVMITIQSFMR